MKALLLAVLVAAVSAQNPPVVNSSPINGLTAAVCVANPRILIADSRSRCYFYACTVRADGAYRLTPRRCGLGSHVHSDWVSGIYNPCTQRFPIWDMYLCDPTPSEEEGFCSYYRRPNCTHGATLQQEGDLCWCNCSLEWQGSPDCSIAKKSTPVTDLSTVCPGGAPLDNWCAKALPNGANPCLNGGICINQCTSFICNCTVPNVKDKRCSLNGS